MLTIGAVCANQKSAFFFSGWFLGLVALEQNNTAFLIWRPLVIKLEYNWPAWVQLATWFVRIFFCQTRSRCGDIWGPNIKKLVIY